MPANAIHSLESAMCQHDFEGQIIFQHRNMAKWSITSANKKIAGFKFEAESLDYLEQLKKVWSGKIPRLELEFKSEKSEFVPATSAA